MDIVIVVIPSPLLMPYVFDSTFFIPSWNQSADNFIDSIILFSNKFLSENGAMLLFHADDLRVLKEI